MDKITAVGLDLAKQIIQVHAIDAAGRVVLRKAVRRERLLALLAQLPCCVVGMEACSGAHHWARELKKLGHEPRIMAAEFARPFRKSLAAKNDANGCRGDLYGSHTTEHALGGAQECRAAGVAEPAPGAPRSDRGTHGDDQPVARCVG
jgi:hypothetical protein